MTAAVELFRETRVDGRKIFVLGAMKELGEQSRRLHAEIGRLLAEASFDRVLFYGEEAESAYAAYCEAGGQNGFYTGAFSELEDYLRRETQPGDRVFLKGSRSLRLESLESVLES